MEIPVTERLDQAVASLKAIFERRAESTNPEEASGEFESVAESWLDSLAVSPATRDRLRAALAEMVEVLEEIPPQRR